MTSIYSWLNAQIDTDADNAFDKHRVDCRYVISLYDDRYIAQGCDCGAPARAEREVAFKLMLLGLACSDVVRYDYLIHWMAAVYSDREDHDKVMYDYEFGEN
jgi:hypothetical protein